MYNAGYMTGHILPVSVKNKRMQILTYMNSNIVRLEDMKKNHLKYNKGTFAVSYQALNP